MTVKMSEIGSMNNRYLTALLVMGTIMAGCTKQLEEIPGQTGNDETLVTLTTSITLGEDPGTKALTAEGVKTFAVGDVITVVYENTSGSLAKTETAALTNADITDGGKKANITVSLDSPAQNGALRYIYPAAMANSDGSVNYDALHTQDGTLTYLANHFDLAIYEGVLTSSARLPESVTLTNPLCIGEFTIKDKDSDIITSTLTGFYVSDGTNSYAISRSAAAGPIYVAMRPIANEATISLAAQTGSSYYERSVTGEALAAGKIYPVNVRMEQTQTVNLAKICSAYEAQDGETLTGKLALCKRISIADGATVTLRDVDINGDSSFSKGEFSGITCTGKAELVIKGTNTVKGCKSNWPGIFPKSNKTLTISGDGSLRAIGNTYGAGIGTPGTNDRSLECGNIKITGGTVEAIGGGMAAGIGTGCINIKVNHSNLYVRCGRITISGGTVTAIGGNKAAGIGLGYSDSVSEKAEIACGAITIETGVTRVTATRGSDNSNIYCIGQGHRGKNVKLSVSRITIGGIEYHDGVNPESGDTYIYEPQH